MTKSARCSAEHSGLDEHALDALETLAAALAPMLARMPAHERRVALAAFNGCLERTWAACLDSYRIDSCLAMTKAVAHAGRLTRNVGATLRALEADLERVERIEPGARIRALFPEFADAA